MTLLDRRRTLAQLGGVASVALWPTPSADALGLPPTRSRSIRYYNTPGDAQGRQGQPMVNQSTNIVTIETESGLMGIGEGGEPRTMEQCAGMLIGQDPFRIENLWQRMMRGYFYPAGREKTHSLGALDVALWDLKGKALGVPVWQLLGGKSRDYVECYATAYPGRPRRHAGRRGARLPRCGLPRLSQAADIGGGREVDRFALVQQSIEDCAADAQRRRATAAGRSTSTPNGSAGRHALANDRWSRLRPYFCEDLIRGENIDIYKTMRPRLRVPIAVGENYGVKWDINTLIEQKLIDFARCTVPNVGGITEYMKIAALAETHYFGMIPHFTGPIGETALVHCLTATSVIALMEMPGAGRRPGPICRRPMTSRTASCGPTSGPGLGVRWISAS